MELTLVFALSLLIAIGIKFKLNRNSNQKTDKLEQDLLSLPPDVLDKLLKKYGK